MLISYVLITAARNEELYIEKTIESVTSQTIRPIKWVIVNDGSTDRTEETVKLYSLRYDFIQLYNKKSANIRNFASKVYAILEGLKRFRGLDYDFIGNIDGDIKFGPGYFERLLEKFIENKKLGIAGGWIYELQNGNYKERFGNREHSVPGSVQTFRRECFEHIGGYLPIKTGGEDCIAEVMARMQGWSTQSFPDLRVFHQRAPGAEKANIFKAHYLLGKEDYFVGNHPLFELAKCLSRIPGQPAISGSIFRLFGYIGGLLSGEPIMVSSQIIRYYQKEQMNRIRSLIKVQ